jgi:hypothetical protein
MAFYKMTIELIFESSGDAMNALTRLMECRIYRLQLQGGIHNMTKKAFL